MTGIGNAINEGTTGITGFSGTAFVGTPVTQYDVIVGGATSSTLASVGPGSAGQVLQSGGNAANPAYSTATYPATAGTSGNLITSNGTNFVSSSPGGVGASLVFITSKTASNSASLTFTSIPVYNNYLFVFNAIIPVSATVNLLIQLSTDNGSTYVTSGYKTGFNYGVYNTATLTNANTTAGFLVAPITTGDTSQAYYYIYDTQTGADFTKGNGQASFFTGSDQAFGYGGGNSGNFAAVNAFKILMSSGNISTGTVYLYGIRSS